jgi:hypothetical protein
MSYEQDIATKVRAPVAEVEALDSRTLSGAVTLTRFDGKYHRFDPGGAHRDVTLYAPGPEDVGRVERFYNAADAAENLVIKDAGASTLLTLGQAQWGEIICNEALAHVVIGLGAATVSASTDSISEVTPAAGVTVDGLLIKDAAIAPIAGGSAFINLSAVATGEGDIIIADNLASALEIREAANIYATIVTTNSSEAIASNVRVTTTDGVASGTARKVGGLVAATTAASTAQTGTVETRVVFDQSYTMPANTLKAGTLVKVRAIVMHTATTGTETYTLAVALGSTDIAVTGNLTQNDNGFDLIEFELVCRAAGGSGTVIGAGTVTSSARAAAVTATHGLFSGSAATATTTIDTTASQVVGIAIDRQGSATDGDSARLDYLTVEIIG